MKYIQKKKPIAAICFLCLAIAGCNTEPKTSEAESSKAVSLMAEVYPDEVRLNLCGNVVETGTAADGVYNAYAWILNGTRKMNAFEMVIDTVAIDSLRNAAAAAHTHTACDGFVTGIKTYVGMNNNRLTLLFMPMYMCKDPSSQNTFTVRETSDDLLVYDSGRFVNAGASSIEDTTRYMDSIMFQEPGGPRSFVKADNATGDTRALMVPFQEIMAMVRQNDNSPVVKIWNYADRLKVDNDTLIRQSLLFGPDHLTPEMLLKLRGSKSDASFVLYGPFSSKYADRSSLCPPHCKTIEFTLAQQGVPDCQD